MTIQITTHEMKLEARAKRILQLPIPVQKQGTLFCSECNSEISLRFLSFIFHKNSILLDTTETCQKTSCVKTRGRQFIQHYKLVPVIKHDKKIMISKSEQQHSPINKAKDLHDRLISLKGVGQALVRNIIKHGFDTEQSLIDATVDELKAVQGVVKTTAETIINEFSA